MSASDCPGLTAYCVAAEAGALAAEAAATTEAPAGAAAAGRASASHTQASVAKASASGTAPRVERVVMEMSRAVKRVSRWRLEETKIRCGNKKGVAARRRLFGVPMRRSRTVYVRNPFKTTALRAGSARRRPQRCARVAQLTSPTGCAACGAAARQRPTAADRRP